MITSRLLLYTDAAWWLVSLAEFCVFLLFVRPLRLRREGRMAIVLNAIYFIAWHGIHLLHLDFVFDFCLNVALLSAYLRTTRSCTSVQGIYVACIFCLCTEMGKIVCVDLCMQPLAGWFAGMPPVMITAIWAALSIGVAAVCLLGISRWVFSGGLTLLTHRQGFFILLPLVPYILARGNEQVVADLGNERLYWSMVALSLALGASTIAVIISNAHGLSVQLERNELLRMEGLLREQHAQFLAQKEAEGAIRRQYHDLKHFLVSVDALCDSLSKGTGGSINDLRASIGAMSRDLASYDSRVETGNDVLDVLLSSKRRACVARGIGMTVYADAAHLSFVDSLDLCALFGNLLDNAMEAVERLLDEQSSAAGEDARSFCSQDQMISVDVRHDKGCSFIRVANSYDGVVLVGHGGVRSGGLRTTKPDASRHGIGLRSVRSIVNRYDGLLEVEAGTDAFVVSIVIPLPQGDRPYKGTGPVKAGQRPCSRACLTPYQGTVPLSDRTRDQG